MLKKFAVVFCFSMGCGIGYGYLHRIPIRDSLELPHQPNSSPAPDGFSDVSAAYKSRFVIVKHDSYNTVEQLNFRQ